VDLHGHAVEPSGGALVDHAGQGEGGRGQEQRGRGQSPRRVAVGVAVAGDGVLKLFHLRGPGVQLLPQEAQLQILHLEVLLPLGELLLQVGDA